MVHRAVLGILGAAALAALGGVVGAAGAAATKPAAKDDAESKQKAKEAYDAVVRAYMGSQWQALREADKAAMRLAGPMTAEQRADLLYIRRTAPEYRPAWWPACKSTTQQSIRATIWGKPILCSYAPADKPSVSGTVTGQTIQLSVSWNPALVDSDTPEKGPAAEDHGITKGDFGEVIVWRQLGHSYLNACMPQQMLTMYQENRHLYEHLQSFLGEVTSVYHCSPHSRKTAILLAGNAIIDPGAFNESYVRTCRSLGSLLTALVLADPKQWPSVKLPLTVADANIERETSAYLCNHIDPSWTLNEDRNFREAVKNFFRDNGDRAVRQRGKLLLPNKHTFMLMEPDDRPFQAKRDEWVKQQLQKASK